MPVSIILGLVMEKAWFSQIHLSHSSAAVSDNAVEQTGRGFSGCSTRCSEDIICRDLTGVGRFLVMSISWSFHSWINPCLLLASMYFLVQTALCFHWAASLFNSTRFLSCHRLVEARRVRLKWWYGGDIFVWQLRPDAMAILQALVFKASVSVLSITVPKRGTSIVVLSLMTIACHVSGVKGDSLTKMSCKSTRTHSRLMKDKAHLRGLWVAPERR